MFRPVGSWMVIALLTAAGALVAAWLPSAPVARHGSFGRDKRSGVATRTARTEVVDLGTHVSDEPLVLERRIRVRNPFPDRKARLRSVSHLPCCLSVDLPDTLSPLADAWVVLRLRLSPGRRVAIPLLLEFMPAEGSPQRQTVEIHGRIVPCSRVAGPRNVHIFPGGTAQAVLRGERFARTAVALPGGVAVQSQNPAIRVIDVGGGRPPQDGSGLWMREWVVRLEAEPHTPGTRVDATIVFEWSDGISRRCEMTWWFDGALVVSPRVVILHRKQLAKKVLVRSTDGTSFDIVRVRTVGDGLAVACSPLHRGPRRTHLLEVRADQPEDGAIRVEVETTHPRQRDVSFTVRYVGALE